ncbi:CarboxypepD_reg-like domain-containing protein [Pustulibacterium marinum]|uniref:CarboxypepD_reg-like domain-containing protein n=1 Tax=Pustulibacterium marinum TaxID=1224947 RepID=A0A1I7GAM7_9FLAO|nr:carboxypeptidase-like regulatory domain-containing protein [Pustulibacterium marinum]SFU45306.1 CarboxypepD_reg-like domain-containing protein [Pustulibacterium marinum]
MNVKTTCFLFFLFVFVQLHAQKGIISGVLTDDEGLPLPGVTIQIKGTDKGTQTDFDGIYSIDCKVGDVLIITFVGMKTKEVTVTPQMFQKATAKQPNTFVEQIYSDAYTEAIKRNSDTLATATQTKKWLPYEGIIYNSYNMSNIKKVKVEDTLVSIQTYDKTIYYQITYNGTVSWRFADKNTQPALQNTYVQGRPANGSYTYFGPEMNELFSFGPELNNFNSNENGVILNPADNSILETTKLIRNQIGLEVSNRKHQLQTAFTHHSFRDIFDTEKGYQFQTNLKYTFDNNTSAFLKTSSKQVAQPDINGLYSNVLRSAYTTPINFQNENGYVNSDNTQRSFSPANMNNPYWLLNQNENQQKVRNLLTSITTKQYFGDFYLNGGISFLKDTDRMQYALPKNTVGFSNGYRSEKHLENSALEAHVATTFEPEIYNADIYPKFTATANYSYQKFDYHLLEQTGFENLQFTNPESETLSNRNLHQHLLRYSLEAFAEVDNWGSISLKNNAVYSSLQQSEFFLPAVGIKIRLNNLLDFSYSDFCNSLNLTFNYAKDANEMPLYYSNTSHNSLRLLPEEAYNYTTNNDLFASKNLNFETGKHFDIGTEAYFFNNKVTLTFNYFNDRSEHTILPVWDTNAFLLQNAADIHTTGIDISAGIHPYYHNDFGFGSTIHFNTYRATVSKLHTNATALPVAGFVNVNKQLIVGEQTGTIVGSAFERDAAGNKIIGADGFPLVAEESKIIGNTTPDFTMGFENTFHYKKLNLLFVIDWQQGGDVWNGTESVLNYYGRSATSANQRTITNYVFEGVTQTGMPNTTAVAFADPNSSVNSNRWVRYGYSGVAEEAISSATYINLKSIQLSYDFATNHNHTFFRQLEVALYAENLFCYTQTKGISPYASLFNSQAGNGLHYFNMPLMKEIGLKVNIKI